jgi:hypothetical protein
LKKSFEQQIKKLEQQLGQQQIKLQETTNATTIDLHNKNLILEKALDEQKNTFNIVVELENEIKHLQNQLQEMVIEKEKREVELKAKNSKIEFLNIKSFEAKEKVNEALLLVEAAMLEKEEAVLYRNQVKGIYVYNGNVKQ